MRQLLPFLVCCLLSAFALQAQSPLDRRVDFSVQGAALEDALYELMERADLSITFTSEILPDRNTSLTFENTPVRVILDNLLLRTDLNYTLLDDQIILARRPPPARTFQLSGYLQDARSGERLIGANVYAPELRTGVSTNEYGFYSIELPKGTPTLRFSYLGYRPLEQRIEISRDRTLTLGLEPALTLSAVTVLGNEKNLLRYRAYEEDIPPGLLEDVPGLGGDKDVLRTAQLLSGIQSGADGFGGMSVRGGNVDQNLYLLDGAPVYNGLHGYGLSSIYNSDAIRMAKIYKGSFPARYGGRLSSVVDVHIKEGNLNEPHVSADVGITSGKMSIEGPLVKERTSFFVSARRSFFDLYTPAVTRQIRENDPGREGEWNYFYYDLNAKINHRFSDRDKIFLSFYRGGDKLEDLDRIVQVAPDTAFRVYNEELTRWGNNVGAFRWNHVFGPKLFGNLTLTYSRYEYRSRSFLDNQFWTGGILQNRESVLLQYASNNQDLTAKLDFDYTPSNTQFIRFGLSATRHRFQPGIITLDNESVANLDTLSESTIEEFLSSDALRSTEVEGYLENDIEFNERLALNVGLRFTTLFVNRGVYATAQPRAALTYAPNRKWAFSVGGGRHVQTLHLLSNTGIGLPLDLWVTSTERVRPQLSWQTTAGILFQPDDFWTFELEGYRKFFRNLIAFQDGAVSTVDAVSWQDRIVTGSGEAQGVEFRFGFKRAKTRFQLNYTYADSERTFPDLNGGEPFPYRFDRRHSLNLLFAQRFNDRWRGSVSFTYGSGMAFTVPAQEFLFAIPGFFFRDVLTIYSERNRLRMPANHRLDLGASYLFPNGKFLEKELSFGIYNTYNRTNPLYFGVGTRLNDETGLPRRVYTQTSLFPVFPYVRFALRW